MGMTMTCKQREKRTFVFIPALLLILSLGFPNAFAGDYGYQAIDPDGGEVIKSKGRVWTYQNSLSNNGNHIDRILYVTDVGDFTAGVGYYTSQTSGVETYKWLRYWDEGGTYNNQHWLSSTGPSSASWVTIEVYEVDSNTYAFKAGGSSLGNLDCHVATCDSTTITGVASWGTSTSSSDSNIAQFDSLVLEDTGDADTGYISWNTEANQLKCNNSPSTMKFEWPLSGNNIDYVVIDAGSTDECSIDSSVWLYNGGSGG
jgi:hypothetical protein